MSIRGVVLGIGLTLTAAAAPGDELTPERRRQLEQEVLGLSRQVVTLFARAQYGEAAAAAEKAVAIDRRLYPKGDHPGLALSLSNLSAARQKQGNLAAAEGPLREAVAVCRRLERADQPSPLALCLNNLGSIQQARGNLAGAEESLREAVTLLRRRVPQGNALLAAGLNNLGDLLRDRGDLVAAEDHLRAGLALYRRLYPKGHPDLARAHSNLGLVLQKRGDLGGAEAHLRAALAMRRRLFPGDHPDLAAGLALLGWLRWARNDSDGAEKLVRPALAMFRRLYPDRDHPQLANCLDYAGWVRAARGDLDGAAMYFRAALEMWRRLHPGDHPRVAQSLDHLGALLRRRGELGEAERLLRAAVAMRRRLHPDGHLTLADSLNQVGLLRQRRGDLDGAAACFREALALYQRFLVRQAGLAEAEALDLAASLPLARDSLLSVTRDRAGAADYELLWQGRSAVTRLLERRHRDLLASRDPEARQLADRLLSARQRLAHAWLAPDQGGRADELRALAAAKEKLERELARRLRLGPAADDAAPPPQRLAAALPADAAFLDVYRYFSFDYDPALPGSKGERITPRYAAFLLVRGRPAVRVELGPAEPAERAWAAWHAALTRGAAADRERAAAAALARLVWEPLRRHLPAGVRTVYLAPDGALTQVPFAALPGRRRDTVLLEEFAFATVPHGPFLLARLTAAAAPMTAGGTLLGVGGVAYEKASEREAVWKELPGTGRELARVAALAKKAAGPEVELLTGAAATTARVLEELPRARYAHLATHGSFADPKLRPVFALDPQQAPYTRLAGRRGAARSPLVLTGLVFAGANRTGDDAAEDRGILTAEAVVGLRLDGLELAVLSACHTGLGEVGGGEGVYGLQRAFHLAGCRDVIASLWAVDDDATAALMALFYRNLWERKLDPLQALRQAQLELYRRPQRVKEVVTRDADWTPRPLPPAETNPAGARAPTRQWAAFTFSGVAAPNARRSGS